MSESIDRQGIGGNIVDDWHALELLAVTDFQSAAESLFGGALAMLPVLLTARLMKRSALKANFCGTMHADG